LIHHQACCFCRRRRRRRRRHCRRRCDYSLSLAGLGPAVFHNIGVSRRCRLAPGWDEMVDVPLGW